MKARLGCIVPYVATKLTYDSYISVCTLLIPNRNPQPPMEAGTILGEITNHPLVGPAKGDNKTTKRDFE